MDELRQTLGATGDDGEPVVVMRRMPASRRLSTLLGDPDRRPEARRCDDDVAHLMARFHAALPPVRGYDLPGTMTSLWREGWQQTRRFAGDVLDAEALDETFALAAEYLDGRTGMLPAREHTGLVRDGHGDLLADDIHLLDDGARVLDCLEFDDRLRVGDVLLDLAFLMMDLTLHDAPDLSGALVECYRRLDAESHPRSLEHHYVAYRAWVRAKVECLRHEAGDVDARRRAPVALELSRREARATRIHLVAVGGLPGSGKSVLSRALVDLDDRDWALMSSDEIRKEFAGLPPTVDAGAPFGTGIYDAAHTAATYTEMARRATTALDRGINVVLDASWTDERQRAMLQRVAADHHAALTPTLCVAPLDMCRARLTARRTEPHVSDADHAVLRRMAERTTGWPDAVGLDTTGTPQRAAAELRAILDERPTPSTP